MPHPRFVSFLPLAMLCATAATQCDLQWRSAGGFPGANGIVYASTPWDPDGPGPLPSAVVLGGAFTVFGDVRAGRIATYDPITGESASLGSFPSGSVRALLSMPSGELIAGGDFPGAVARWDGSGWTPLGGGLKGSAYALVLMPDNDVVAVGTFGQAGPVHGAAARFDGIAWSTMNFPGSGYLLAAAVDATGALYVGGNFVVAGNPFHRFVSRWSNGSWSAVGNGVGQIVRDLAVLPNGDLIAAGDFAVIASQPANGFARWNGVAWSGMGAGIVGSVTTGQSLLVDTSGVLHGGTRTTGAVYAWDGTAWNGQIGLLWSTPGPGSSIHSLTEMPDGGLLVGGDFPVIESWQQWPNIFRLRNAGAEPIAAGFGGGIRAIGELSSGEVIVGGDSRAQPYYGTYYGVFRRAGQGWTTHAAVNGPVQDVLGTDAGDVLVAGSFAVTTYPPFGPPWTAYNRIARIGSSFEYLLNAGWIWFPLAGSVLTAVSSGEVLVGSTSTNVGGVESLASGASWSTQLYAQSLGPVRALVERAPGEYVVGFENSGVVGVSNFVEIWDGSVWLPLGGGVGDSVCSLVVASNGDVIAGGAFVTAGGTSAKHVARWDGANWTALGAGIDGPVYALLALPGGEILAGGDFTTAGNQPAANLARWNGASWSPVGLGTNGVVRKLFLDRNGTVWIGGDFTTADTFGAGNIARLVTPCRATVVATGQGCTGSGGHNELEATSLPWLASTFTSAASGMPALGLAVSVSGIAPAAVPLSWIVPQAGAACDLLAVPTVLDVRVPSNGAAAFALPLPNATVVIGQQLWQQVVALAFDGNASLIEVTSTNALELLVGGL